MEQEIRDQLRQLARLLRQLEPAFWEALDTDEGASDGGGRTHRVLATACDAIHRLAMHAIGHLSSVPNDPPTGPLSKAGHAIANQPGLALLPAPSDPAVNRWQRTTSEQPA